MEFKNYWNQRYSSGGNSGYGSYGEQLEKKLKWLSGLDIDSVTEIGCGDFNFGSKLMEMYPKAEYFGYDISDVIITQNAKKWPQYHFTSGDSIGGGDLVLCIDVLFHTLKDEDYNETLLILDSLYKQGKYLAVTAYEYNQTENLGAHVKIRKFDPSRFGVPLIREIVEEDGQLYFYLFKRPVIRLQEVTAI